MTTVDIRQQRDRLIVVIQRGNGGGRVELRGERQYIAQQTLGLLDLWNIAAPESRVQRLRDIAGEREAKRDH